MALTPDEQKAVNYQAAEQRRLAYGRFLQSKLKAPAGPATQTKKNWSPLIGRRIK
jgi:hypothetical protein